MLILKKLNTTYFNLKIDEGGECFSYLVKDLAGFDFTLLKEDGFNFLQLHELSPDSFIDPDDFEDVCGELINNIINANRDAINSVKSLVADHKEKVEVFFINSSTSYFSDNGYNLWDKVELCSIEEFYKELDRLESHIDCDGYYYLGDWYAALLSVNRFALMVNAIIK